MEAPAQTKRWSVGEAIRWTSSFFAAKGLDSPRLEAELLLAHVLSCGRVDLYVHFDRPLSDGERADYRGLVRRRGCGEPLQHLLGYQVFRHLRLEVGPQAFIPRPETEVLVDVARRIIRSWPHSPVVADVGTGTGAIALSLAKEVPGLAVIATDLSEEALEIARKNAEVNGLAGCVRFLKGHLLEPLARPGVGPIDILVSNPPYVATAEIAGLPPEVRRDPLLALDGGEEGLRCYPALAAAKEPLLAKRAAIILEIGAGQEGQVRDLLAREGWGRIRVHADLAGMPRVVEGQREGFS